MREGQEKGELAATVFHRLLASGGRAFRTVTVTVRFADFVTLSRSHTVRIPVSSAAMLEAEALRLLAAFFDDRENPRRKPIRLIGVRAEKLVRAPSSPTALPLLDPGGPPGSCPPDE